MEQPYSNVRRVKNNVNTLDTHELLKKEISRQDYNQRRGIGGGEEITFASSTILGEVNRGPTTTVVENHGFEDTELYFDSVYRNRTSELNNGEIIWNMTTLNNAQEISNIIELHLGDFYFPKINSASTAPEFFYFGKVYVELLGTTSQQSVLGPNGQKFHFECNVENLTGQAVRLVPVKKSYFFAQPINWLVDFQIRFMVPQTVLSATIMKRIPIPSESVTINSLTTGGFGFNPIRFRISDLNDTLTLGLVGSLGAPGVAIFITGYASNDAATNTAVNNPDGIFATTVINGTDFEIAGINAAAVTGNFTALMYVPKNRIAFPLRFTSVKSSITNHMDVGHQ